MKLLKKILLVVLGIALLWFIGGLLLFRFVNPPVTLTMLISAAKNQRWVTHQDVPLEKVSSSLQRAVIAAEDGRFCAHHGIDFGAVQAALGDFQENGKLRGASTISMQVSRNVFLWTGGGFVRKVVEAPLALALDAVWPKSRVMEIYLNIAEWGPGVFGAEAAARHYFRKPAAALTPREAARLAAILPNPIRFSASKPTRYVEQRTNIIERRMRQLNSVQRACIDR
jgi:monofunctional biosynthetic peptidoglycan transglycosylase